jgi:MFS family permease
MADRDCRAVGLALINDTFDKEEIGQAMGYVGISTSLGILLAPLLGGLVYAHSGYYAVFAMAFGLIAVDIVLRLAIIEKSVAARLEGSIVENGTEVPMEVSNSQARADIALVEMQDGIGNLPGASQSPHEFDETIHSAQTRSSNTQTTAKRSPLKVLLTSRRFLTASWGTTVQAILLTAFDSVSIHLFTSQPPANHKSRQYHYSQPASSAGIPSAPAPS